MKHFNNLTPAQAERLAILLEESGELQQAIGKALRHGYNSFDPTNEKHKGNAIDVAEEMADVTHAIEQILRSDDVPRDSFTKKLITRSEKLSKYTHHLECK